MDLVTAFIGVGIFGSIAAALFISLAMESGRERSTVAMLLKKPRAIAGCVCLALTLLCCLAML